MDIIILAAVTVLGFFGGIYSATVGGYGLLVVPALIFLGVPPHEAIGTDKMAAIGITLTSWAVFHKKKLVDYKVGSFTALFAVLGSVVGAVLLLGMGTEDLKKAISIATVAMLAVIMLKKDAGMVRRERGTRRHEWVLGAILSFAVGIYGGFYGGGFATLQSYVLILLFGQTFIESAATRKVASILVIGVTAVILGMNGKIDYALGIPLTISSSLGGYLGAHYATKLGNVWVKRMFFAVVLLMSAKLYLTT